MVESRPTANEHQRLSILEQRVAVSEQIASDIGKTLTRLDTNFDRLDTKLDAFMERSDLRGAEAEGSPAGRSLLTRFGFDEQIISAHGHRLEELEEWRSELQGAFNLVRLALGTSVVAAIAATLAIIGSIRHGF